MDAQDMLDEAGYAPDTAKSPDVFVYIGEDYHQTKNKSSNNKVEAKPTLMGAQDMLYEAGNAPNTHESWCVFVCDLDRTGNSIRLDLEKDKLDLEPEDLEISCDIDSIIWVTRNLVAKGAINIHLAPYKKDKLSFALNPFVYTDLLKPPRDDWENNHP
jgi:hypothetical protein